MAKHKKRTKQKRTPIEEADVKAAKTATAYRDHPVVRGLGSVSELADQPPLAAICGAVIVAGAVAGKPRLIRAGIRMLAAHGAATLMKTVVKKAVDRTRPQVLVEEGRYELARGKDSDDHMRTSFPSGHTASAMATARAFGREYPEHQAAALAAARAVAAVQVPRGAHYPTDVIAGGIIGRIAEAAVDLAFSASVRRLALQRGAEPG
ncbi:phosphatase PAP2 family protein [Sphingomonas sp. ID0503]|uniref:phosphatase PAP2 family protein n=1 Tax=Sphingomonas sp. ID0503 TaxID=3399691 RepID=UPI003AFB7787